MKITDKRECDITGDMSDQKDEMLFSDTISERKSGIYKIINRNNGNYYVGRSSNIKIRWGKHIHLLEHNRHWNDHLQNAWNKYGKHIFEFVIVENVIGVERLLNTEQYFLDIAKTEQDKCYNKNFIADYTEMTDEIKQKISESLRGNKNVRYGVHHTEETLYQMSQSNLGKHLTTEQRNKIKLSNQGRKFLNRSRPSIVYRFHNTFTNETFNGTRTKFCHKFQIPSARISDLLYKRRTRVKGWSLINP
jgi:group I intron endonuclease